MLISPITIVYPDEAKARKIEGRVTAALLIDTAGGIETIEIRSSDSKLLDQAAIDALRKARFRPAMFGGKPERSWYQQTLTFTLSASDTSEMRPIRADSPPMPMQALSTLFAYPPDAKAAAIEGSVVLNALIDTNGIVQSVEVAESSLPVFEAPAVNAMRIASFTPAIENGVKVKAWYRQQLKFSLPSPYVNGVVGYDSSITAAPELLGQMPIAVSKTQTHYRTTSVRILVGSNGKVLNVLALDKHVDPSTLENVLTLAYGLPFAPGLMNDMVAEMWTDVTFQVLPKM